MWARNRVGIELPYRPARLLRLAELIPWNQFLGSFKSLKIPALCVKTEGALPRRLRLRHVAILPVIIIGEYSTHIHKTGAMKKQFISLPTSGG
jgi:hypothetical protein